MLIVLLDNRRHQFNAVESQVNGAEIRPQRKMPVTKSPFAERRQLFLRCVYENGFPEVEQIDSTAEPAGTGFGGAMRALGDNAQQPVIAREQCENLRSLAVLD